MGGVKHQSLILDVRFVLTAIIGNITTNEETLATCGASANQC